MLAPPRPPPPRVTSNLCPLQMTFQQICKDVHMVKTNGQQMFIESRNRPLPRKTSAGSRPSPRDAPNVDTDRGQT